jgi:ABC-type transport system involved in multi-copper enzyme maturation permease subunit
MKAIILNTFREALAKKIFIGYYIFYVIVIISMFIIVNQDTIEGLASLTDLTEMVKSVQAAFIGLSFPLILFFSIISTASFIPSMTEKGTIDLMISKPLSRTQILIAKFTGAVLFVFLSFVFLIGSIWLILSAKSGYWDPSFLLSIFTLTIAYAVLYSIVVLIGLMTNSSIVAILVNFFLIFVLAPILSIRETMIFSFVKNSTIQFIFNFLYYVFPKPGEIKDITISLIMGMPIGFWKGAANPELGMTGPSWMALITSIIFGIVVMSYSIFYFSKKDY